MALIRLSLGPAVGPGRRVHTVPAHPDKIHGSCEHCCQSPQWPQDGAVALPQSYPDPTPILL